ncbi:MAG: HEPN domain-containing protein [Selenomonadaceae bacterium]|nr:HEPN domain-containing protein [Selenomonadaceae bacterium]
MRPPEQDVGTSIDLAIYRMDCAAEDLRVAKLLMENGAYKTTINRAYYAIFHAITALHSLNNRAYKRHKDTLGNFNKLYIHTGVFPKEWGGKVMEAEAARHSSDYGDFYNPTNEEAQKQLDFASHFVHTVKSYFESQLAERNTECLGEGK